MIKFIKNLLGFGAKESVQEILTPQAPYKLEPPEEVTITRILAPESNPNVVVTPVKTTTNKVKVNEGKTRANVKKTNPNSKKPLAPPAPKPKSKNKSKPKSKK